MKSPRQEFLKTGLSLAEAKKKLAEFGPNEIQGEEKPSWSKLLLTQFKSPLIYILFFAGLVTLVLKEWTDSVVIFLAVGLNTILGFAQEYKAENALVALRKILVPHAWVVREGKEEAIETVEIVPGDLVVLKTGEKIPADGILIKTVDFHANEAILTGESASVAKKKNSKVFMGTGIASGRGIMVVSQTGRKTKMGQIATQLTQTVEEETPLKNQIGQFSKILAIIFSFICVVIFFEGLWRGREILEMFTLSVAVAVAAIPEGLVISLTVILTLGMQRILKKKGLVRRLLAAETLGSVDVICADKTGTLTEGRMRVVKHEVDKSIKGASQEMIEAAVLCNNLTNPLEMAMMQWARQELGTVDQLIGNHPRLAEIPFSSERKLIAVLVSKGETQAKLIFSGAPEMIMGLSQMSPAEKKKWQEILDRAAKKGLRVVAFSQTIGDIKVLEKHLTTFKNGFQKYDGQIDDQWGQLRLGWLGLLFFEDPVRLEVKEALDLCKRAGIAVKVITGDYRRTAMAVLDQLKIAGEKIKDDQVMEGWELEKLSIEELSVRAEQTVLFARTTPEQKIRIVEALQSRGHSLAMMGDGVNDALALKKADIGVVVGEASEVAKETADMVLLDSNFQTIVASIEEGRGIFENIKKVVLYLLSDSFTEVILIGGSLLLGLPTPLLPAQILWVNLVEDGLPGLALAFEPKDEGLMQEKPRDKKAPILDKEIKTIIFIIGLSTDLLLLGTFWFLLKTAVDFETIQTVIFAGLAINSLLYVFSCKTMRKNLWQEDILSNRFLVFSVLFGVALLLGGVYFPFLKLVLKTKSLEAGWWLLILALGLVNIAGIELVKWLFLRVRQKKKT